MLRLPVIEGVIDRRILVNYHCDPDVMARVLPPPFKPKVVSGHTIGGICLIRLKHMRPQFLPISSGISSENAAHRVAVEWEKNGGIQEGVYIPRRDTNSRLNTLVGGRLFSGAQHHASFRVEETEDHFSVSLESDDGQTQVRVSGGLVDRLPETSVFSSIEDASAFFEKGSLGYAATDRAGRYDGLELQCKTWSVEPLNVEEVASSFFEDQSRFPSGSVGFDCGLLMRGIEHKWHSREDLCCPATLGP
jgi:hypothetical protein